MQVSDDMKLLGFAGALMMTLFTWVFHTITIIEQHAWTAEQQAEYRANIQTQIDNLKGEVDRLRKKCDALHVEGFTPASGGIYETRHYSIRFDTYGDFRKFLDERDAPLLYSRTTVVRQ